MGAAGEIPLEAEALAAPARESDLVALCRQGDPAAFARLVALHESMVFNLAARLLGQGDAVERLVGSLQADSAKATRLLGWTPRVSVGDGLRRTVEWYLASDGDQTADRSGR